MRSSEAGQSVVDVLVASALLAVLGMVLLLVLGVTQTGLTATTSKSTAETAARRLLDGVARSLRSARPVGWCPTAPGANTYSTPADQCTHVSDYWGWPAGAPVPAGPLTFAGPSELWFWDYGDSSVALRVPDCVQLVTTPTGDVLVNRWRGAGTYTTPSCPGVGFARTQPPQPTSPPATSTFVGHLAAGTPRRIFTLLDASGNTTATPSTALLVSIAARFTFVRGVASAARGSYTVEVEALLRATIYQHEQVWDAQV